MHCGRQLFKGSLRLAHWHTPRIGRLSIQLPVRLCIERGFRRQADRGAVTDAFQYQRLSTGVSPARSARNCDSAAALAPKWPFPVVKPASYLDSGPLNNPDRRDGSGLVEGPCCCGIDVRKDTAFAGLHPPSIPHRRRGPQRVKGAPGHTTTCAMAKVTRKVRTFQTTTADLLRFSDWWNERMHAAMEATMARPE